MDKQITPVHNIFVPLLFRSVLCLVEKVLEGDPLNALEEKANATLEPSPHQQSDVTLVPVHSGKLDHGVRYKPKVDIIVKSNDEATLLTTRVTVLSCFERNDVTIWPFRDVSMPIMS